MAPGDVTYGGHKAGAEYLASRSMSAMQNDGSEDAPANASEEPTSSR